MRPEDKTALAKRGRQAVAHGDQLTRELTGIYPNAWRDMDRLRRDPPMPWPPWCLLPMAAAAAVWSNQPPGPPQAIAALSGLYAWRNCRSAWLVEPGLLSRLLGQIPDHITITDLQRLPEWCMFVPDPDWPESGLWMHLEHDAGTGRPELRLMLDLGGGISGLQPIPVYLDRPTLVEALSDYPATALATLTRAGANVRGGDADITAAQLAERIDGYVGVAAYLARPEADITCLTRPEIRPCRGSQPAKGSTVWLVGYADS